MHILENIDYKMRKTNLECTKGKCEANRSKSWVTSTKYASCTSSR